MRVGPLLDRGYVSLAALGVLLRLVGLWLSGDLEPVLDEGAYLYHAVCWESFGFHVDSGRWLWPPGYPFFLKTLLGAFGAEGVQVAKLLQVLASSVTGYSTMLLAGTLFQRRAGLIAGGLWCVYLPMIGFTHYLWPEPLFLALFVPALYLLLRWSLAAPEENPTVWLLPAGLLLGLASLVKESASLLALPLAVGVLWRHRGSYGEGARAASLLLLSVLVVVLPWSLRNAELYGKPVPAATLGANCWVGISGRYRNYDYPIQFLAPGEDAYASIYEPGDWRRRSFIQRPAQASWGQVVRSTGEGAGRSAIELSALETRQAMGHVLRYPGLFLAGRVKQLSNWVTPTSFFVRHLGMDRYPGLEQRDGPRRLLLSWALLLSMFVLVAAVPGLVLALRSGAGGFVVPITLLYALSLGLLVGMSRHRMIIEPLLIALGSGFLARPSALRDRGRGPGRGRGLGLAAGGWALLGGLWYLAAPEVLAAAQRVWG